MPVKQDLLEVVLTPEVKEIVERIRQDLRTHCPAVQDSMAAFLYTFNFLFLEIMEMDQELNTSEITYGKLIKMVYDLANCSGEIITVDHSKLASKKVQ